MPDAEARRLVGIEWLIRTTRRARGFVDSHKRVPTYTWKMSYAEADRRTVALVRTAYLLTTDRSGRYEVHGEPLSQQGKPGAVTVGGPLHANARPAD